MKKLEMRARRFIRRTGVTQAIKRVLYAKRYEAAFERTMQAVIRSDDVIWDVGAKAGYFSTRFAQWTGPQGTVFVFEPASDIAVRLDGEAAPVENIRIVRQWLSGADRAASQIAVHSDRPAGETAGTTTGDLLIASGAVMAPDVIRIDIKDHAFEALMGMSDLLRTNPPRHLFIEIHGSFAYQKRQEILWRIEKFLRDEEFDVARIGDARLHALLRI